MSEAPPKKKARWGRRGQRRLAQRQAGSGTPLREEPAPSWASKSVLSIERQQTGGVGERGAAAQERRQ